MMKKTVIAVTAVLLCAVALSVLILHIADASKTPEQVAAEYIKACMLQNVSDMIKYSSDYNKAMLNGGSMPDDGALKKKLENAYKQDKSIYAGKDISFGVSVSRELDRDSTEYEDVYLEYSRLADADKITAVYYTEFSVYVDGIKQQTDKCYVVKVNGSNKFAYQKIS